jgi:hypothetical protein
MNDLLAQMSLILNMISDGGVLSVGTMTSKRNPHFEQSQA